MYTQHAALQDAHRQFEAFICCAFIFFKICSKPGWSCVSLGHCQLNTVDGKAVSDTCVRLVNLCFSFSFTSTLKPDALPRSRTLASRCIRVSGSAVCSLTCCSASQWRTRGCWCCSAATLWMQRCACTMGENELWTCTFTSCMSDVLQCDGLYLTDVAKKEKKEKRGKKRQSFRVFKTPSRTTIDQPNYTQ